MKLRRFLRQSPGVHALSALDPGKQGLKLSRTDKWSKRSGLSALDPGKQGLKHGRRQLIRLVHQLSALDPGKQGLKLFLDVFPGAADRLFQRLIQENKD